VIRLRRVRADDPVLHTEWNKLCDAVERLQVQVDGSSGLEVADTPGGQVLRFAGKGTALRPAKAPAGGIPALSGATPGSATVTFYTWDGTSFSLGSETATAKNVYGSAVGANKLVWVTRWRGTWFVLTEACA
jgi:hypothetical protein